MSFETFTFSNLAGNPGQRAGGHWYENRVGAVLCAIRIPSAAPAA